MGEVSKRAYKFPLVFWSRGASRVVVCPVHQRSGGGSMRWAWHCSLGLSVGLNATLLLLDRPSPVRCGASTSSGQRRCLTLRYIAHHTPLFIYSHIHSRLWLLFLISIRAILSSIVGHCQCTFLDRIQLY